MEEITVHLFLDTEMICPFFLSESKQASFIYSFSQSYEKITEIV